MRYFVQIGCEFSTAGYLVFWKPYPWVKILKNMLNSGSEHIAPNKTDRKNQEAHGRWN